MMAIGPTEFTSVGFRLRLHNLTASTTIHIGTHRQVAAMEMKIAGSPVEGTSS